jgi:UDP-glucose:(heptosyl)LPS alpha-1,3-glucosyltransferase
MRIALVRQRYSGYGGAERFVSRAVEALASQGVTVTVVARRWSDGGVSDAVGCDPFYIGRLWRDWGFARAACRRLARESFDLVQSHARLACCDVYRAGDGVHRQWLLHRKDAAGWLERARLTLSPYHRYVMAAERRLYASRRLRAVICNSRMVADDIERHFGVAREKLHVLYSGVDLETFSPAAAAAARGPLRARLGIPAPAMTYLLVGSGFERKGVRQLLLAFAALPDRAARLVIVGRRDRRERRLRRLARALGIGDRVHFAGGQQDIAPWYGVADCFVLPSLYDPFPNAVLEALACGLPAIVSDRSGAAELIRPGVNGYVCGALDVPAITGAMAAVAGPGRTGMGEAARASVGGLSLDAMAARLLALYQSLLGPDRPVPATRSPAPASRTP